MAPHPDTLVDLTSEASGSRFAFAVPSGLSLPSAFNQMMNSNRSTKDVPLRDKCYRPEPTYNSNYNPYEKPRSDLPGGYTLYVFPEPLWDDRAAIVARFPRNHTLARPFKKPRTQWVWNLGYALWNHTISGKPSTY